MEDKREHGDNCSVTNNQEKSFLKSSSFLQIQDENKSYRHSGCNHFLMYGVVGIESILLTEVKVANGNTNMKTSNWL